jgi:hypothetical protein
VGRYSCQVAGESNRFVLPHIARGEKLAIEVGNFDGVVIQNRELPDSLPHQGRGNVSDQTSGADANDV